MSKDSYLKQGLAKYPLTTEFRFLLVSLNIDAVLEEVTITQRRKKLDQMIKGNGLRDAYSATLARIEAQKGSKAKLAMDALMWLSHSERPLNANELCHALGVEIGSPDLDSQNIPAIETLLGCSLGLVTVEASTYTVRLVHYSLQEYLSNNTDLVDSPHSRIAQVCLTYLNYQCIIDLPPILDRPPPETPFLGYASCYWGTHAKRDITENVNTLALKLLNGFDKHVSSGILLFHRSDYYDERLRRYDSTGFTGLHCIASLGIVEIAAVLLEMKKWDLNATDAGGNTAILCAVKRGHEAMVKMLLARGHVTPDIADKDGRTPLSCAANFGHGSIVTMILGRRDVALNTVDKYNQTPLLLAAERGHEDIVKTLLERKDVSPNIADSHGQTPLSRAATLGNAGVVELLLRRGDVAPNTADKEGRTPLYWAAMKPREGILKTLLEREDATPDTADKDGITPFFLVARSYRSGNVEMLLEREDVTLNAVDKDG